MSWDKVHQVVSEMMSDRGFTSKTEQVPGEVVVFQNPSLPPKKQVLLYCCQNDKFNIESVKFMVHQLNQNQLSHGIIVYQNIITSSAKKAIEHLFDYTIELFDKKELQYNITKHRLYCPHIKLPKSEIPQQAAQLPLLLRTDAVSRYFHFSRGDVVQIQRKNGAVAYRLVK